MSAYKLVKSAATDLLLKGKLTPTQFKKLLDYAYKNPKGAALHVMDFVVKKGIPEIAEYLVPGTKESMKIANFGRGFRARRRRINHGGGTGVGGRLRPSAAQLRARQLFAARYGNKRRRLR